MTPNQSKSISILGCGWLGYTVANDLINEGYLVKGSRTSAPNPNSVNALFISNPSYFKIIMEEYDEAVVSEFLKSEVLLISIPTSKIHLENLIKILTKATEQGIQKVILISSTGIYSDSNTEVTEADSNYLLKDSKLFEVESLVNSFPNLNPVILRMGGLFGFGRNPLNFSKSPNVLANPDGRINFIYQDDAVKLIIKVIESDIANEIFNCCADAHPTKKEFYTWLAEKKDATIPVFENVTNDSFKIISNQKVKEILNFEFGDL